MYVHLIDSLMEWLWFFSVIGGLFLLSCLGSLLLYGDPSPPPPLSHQAPPTSSRLLDQKRLLQRRLDQLEDQVQHLEQELKD